MSRTATIYRLALSVDEIVERLRARPELRPGAPMGLERHPRRLVVRYDRARPPYEAYELLPQQLWMDLEQRGRCVLVHARVVSRPSARGLAIATVFALSHFGANVLSDLADLRDTRQRRDRERRALLQLAASTFAPLEVGDEHSPFRE